MSFLLRLRHDIHHQYSTTSILSPNSSIPLTSKQKYHAALAFLKTEKNPERILEIFPAASLTADTHLDRVAFSLAISKLSSSNHFDGIRRFLDELKTRPDLRSECSISHAILLACIFAKNYKEVSRIYLQYPKRYEIQPNVDTYNIVVKAFCESDNSGYVYSILDEMDRNNVRPDATTFATAHI